MSEEEDAALAALQGSDETTETEPTKSEEAPTAEGVAGETAAQEVEGGDRDIQPENGESSNGDAPNGDASSEPAEEAVESEASGEPNVQPATMDDVRRDETHFGWVKTLTPRIPKGVTISDVGVMQITQEAEDSDLSDMAFMFSEADLRASRMSMQCQFYIAKTVFELAGRHDVPISQVIDELDLCNRTGRSFDVVYSWCKALGELPDECFYSNLTMSHLVKASRVTKPKDAKALKKFNEKRSELLKEASENPDSMSSRQVERELKQITAALEKQEPRSIKRESIGVIHDRLIDNYRVYRVAEVDPSILDANGIEMADLVNQIEADEGELINRHKIVEDAAQIVLHWTDNQTVDVTEIEGEKE